MPASVRESLGLPVVGENESLPQGFRNQNYEISQADRERLRMKSNEELIDYLNRVVNLLYESTLRNKYQSRT